MSTPRAFKTRAGVNRVTLGGDPRIVIEPGQTFSTDDPGLIAELEANEHLQYATNSLSAASKKTPAKTKKAAAGGEV